MDPKPDDLILPFATSAVFDRWLAKHHGTVTVVWIKHAKKGSGEPSITWTEAVDVALCHGWIDGQAKSIDERYYLQRYTPRRAASSWSKLNRERVARLIADGRMRPAGLAEIDRAKGDGRWDAAYDSPRTAAVPDDLARALAARAAAGAAFAKLDGTNRYAILHRLQVAKQPATRARQIEKYVAMLEAGQTLHPVRRKAAEPVAPKPVARKPAKPTKPAARKPAKPAKLAKSAKPRRPRNAP